MATTGQPALVFPPGRYGRRRDPAAARRRRWLTWVAGGLVALLTLLIAVKLYRQYADPDYAVTIVSVGDISDHGVTVTFDVRVPAGEGATCTVEGHTRDGRLVGRATVDVPPGGPGQRSVRVTYTLATDEAPVTGEVRGCGPRR
jgi:hypothetical protein